METAPARRWFGSAANLPWKLLSAAVLVGITAGLATVGFYKLIAFVESLVFKTNATPAEALGRLSWYWKIALPAAGGAVVAPMVFSWVKEARGHGVSEVMEAVALNQGRIRGRVAVVKTAASTVTIGTGGSVGPEGPVVQVGAAVGSKIGRWLHLPSESVTSLVGCGVAGGIAAIFNAPIAGAFFALEVILGNFAANAFAPIVLASVTATTVSRAFLGNYPAFEVPQHELVSVAEIPLYALLGLLAGVVGVFFIRSLCLAEDFFDSLRIHSYLKPVLGGAIVGATFLVSPHVFGTGFHTMTEILIHGLPLSLLLLLVPLKLLATSVTLGSGGSGGTFSPALFLGAALGGAFGILAHAAAPTWTAAAGAYALVGMGAVLAGATHTPITAILLLFEITGDYEIILPLMVACVIATIVSSVLSRESIYTAKLARHGVNLRMGREETVMGAYRVEDVIRPSTRTVAPGVKLSELVTEFLSSRINERYVVDELGRYRGLISLHDIKNMITEEGLEELVVAEDVAHNDRPPIAPELTLSEAMDRFVLSGSTRLPVVDPETGQFLGTISEHDIISLYNREILKKDFLGTIQYDRATENGHQRRAIQLPTGYRVEAVPLPAHLAGKTLREMNLRARFKLSVVAFQEEGEQEKNEIPNPEYPLSRDEVLVVVGNSDDIERFRRSVPEDFPDVTPVASEET